MQNIYEILKAYGLEVPGDKKGEFDKAVIDNYKTVAEVEKISNKLEKSENDLITANQTITTMTAELQGLKDSSASAEDWKIKFDELKKNNDEAEENRRRFVQEQAERADFDSYVTVKKLEWNNPLIADGYFNKYREAKNADEYKGKTSADIIHALTKDDATAFKTVQPDVHLLGGNNFGDNGNEPTTLLSALQQKFNE